MATPASNGNASNNAAASAPQNDGYDHVRVKVEERDLSVKWIALPHPEIQIASTVLHFKDHPDLPSHTPEFEAYVAATITDKQKARFARIAEAFDIKQALRILGKFGSQMEGSLEEHATETAYPVGRSDRMRETSVRPSGVEEVVRPAANLFIRLYGYLAEPFSRRDWSTGGGGRRE